MEKKFLQKKIKEYFINKPFQEWNKETIDYLVMLININDYQEYHNMLFLLLNDYLLWIKNNISIDSDSDETNKYSYNDLLKIKNDLHDKLYKVVEQNNRIYINDFGDDDIIQYNLFTTENLLYFIFFMLCLLVIRFLFSLVSHHDYNYNSYEHLSKYVPIVEHTHHIPTPSPPKTTKSNIINNVVELLLSRFI